MEWKFEKGVVHTPSVTKSSFLNRQYYVKYTNGKLGRIIGTSYVYSKVNPENKQLFIEALLTKNKELYENNIKVDMNFVPKMSDVITIIDFDEKELTQQPAKIETMLKSFEYLDPKLDDENNHLSIKHFEKYLVKCRINKCVCTVTDDTECQNRVNEILQNGTTMDPQSVPKAGFYSSLIGDPMMYINKIIELEKFVVSQQEEIKSLQDKIAELSTTENPQ